MLSSRIWDCLEPEQKLALLFYQRANHNKRWMPPVELTEPVSEIPSPLTGETEEERLAAEVKPVMEATPGEVKHWPREKV